MYMLVESVSWLAGGSPVSYLVYNLQWTFIRNHRRFTWEKRHACNYGGRLRNVRPPCPARTGVTAKEACTPRASREATPPHPLSHPTFLDPSGPREGGGPIMCLTRPAQDVQRL
ncbi:hypothetical protein LX36DRAFT_459919 [Colletotrichum falcatum]|nr:hypothetical protein LX36DRAFT_459919 [Colletotrichum falcatum]